jgi:hypothetical protein
LEAWRQSQTQLTRLPEAVWAAAASLANTHGVGCVARALRLDYNKLKQRVKQDCPLALLPAPGPAPAFVELQLADSLAGNSGGCRIELADAAGRKMAMHLPGDSAVLALAELFWRRVR